MLKKANAHFSEDLLASLLNEPLVGNGVYWSSAPGTDQNSRPYPISVRVLSFEDSYTMLDPDYNAPAPDSFAVHIRANVEQRRDEARTAHREPRRQPSPDRISAVRGQCTRR